MTGTEVPQAAPDVAPGVELPPLIADPEEAALEAFRGRHRVQVPEELREGAPVTESWPYGRERWEVFAEA